MSDTEDIDASNKKDKNSQSPCPIEREMQMIAVKCKGTILWYLRNGSMRFNELARQIEGASKKWWYKY
jgi:DNA-binding HxlR family transcriptional regulator